MMLFYDDPAGPVAISQPAHAWVCGQLARSWGNVTVGTFAPWEEVCLSAEQHDVGMAEWEGRPTFNAQTGLPHSFMNLPEPLHMTIFQIASRLLLPQNRYAALLASRHFTGLAERFGQRDTPEDARAVDDYLAIERAWQDEVTRGLRADPYYAAFTAPDVLMRNQQLLAIWDWLSLLLCQRLTGSTTVENVPLAEGTTTVTLTPENDAATEIAVAPWPFHREQVRLVVEGRRLPESLADAAALERALAAAPWLTLTMLLHPGE